MEASERWHDPKSKTKASCVQAVGQDTSISGWDMMYWLYTHMVGSVLEPLLSQASLLCRF